jgi:hypothetical protein
VLVVFLPEELKATVNDESYAEAVQRDELLDIIFVCVKFKSEDPGSPWSQLTADENLLQFYDLYFQGKTAVCILLINEVIGYIGPSVGSPEFYNLPETKYTYKFKVPNWKSPMLWKHVNLADLFGSDRIEYLRHSKQVAPATEVFIVHLWGVWCSFSINNWDIYDKLRMRLPKATHMLLHIDSTNGPFTTDTVLGHLPHVHPDFLLAKDVADHFYHYFLKCEYRFCPATFIFVNSKLAYVGEQHITCDINHFPELIETALEDPLFAN